MLLLFGTTVPCPFSNSTQPELRPRLRSRKRMRSQLRHATSQTPQDQNSPTSPCMPPPPAPTPIKPSHDLEVVLVGNKSSSKTSTKAVQSAPLCNTGPATAPTMGNLLQSCSNVSNPNLAGPMSFSVITQSQIIQAEEEEDDEDEDELDLFMDSDLEEVFARPAG